MSGAGIGEAATAGTVCGTGRGEDASTRVHVERTDVRWRAMPPEPTIPEAAVEAAAKALHEIDCQAPKPCGWLVQNDMPSITQGHYDLFRRRARAALAAAEPLMCMATRQANGELAVVFGEQLDTIAELRREIEQLRETLGSCAGFISGCRDDYTPGEWRESRAHRLCLEIAAALAPSTEEGA